MMTKEKRGISLIVLIITMVVIIILATAIIVTLAKTEIIGNASWATWLSNYRAVEEAERLYENSMVFDIHYKEKVYGITNEEVTPSSTLLKTIKKLHSDEYEAELYYIDMEKIGIGNITSEYALDKKDGKIYDIKGHKKGDYIYHVPEIKIVTIQDTEAPGDFSIQAKYDEDTGKITVTVGEVVDNLSTAFTYEYCIQKVIVNNQTQEVTNDGEAKIIKTSKNIYQSDVLEDGTYQVYVNVYDEEGNVKKSTNTETLIAQIVLPDIYVSITGSDDTGDGSKENPYATVSKAIDSAVDGNKIFIAAGTYELEPMVESSYAGLGIYDMSKGLEIYGENEKTILIYDGAKTTKRDGCAMQLSNANTTVRNLTYIFAPSSSTNNYSRAIFRWCAGTVENVFFRIVGSYKASYLYYNDQTTANNVKNCSFYHDLGAVFSSYSGKSNFKNIATNVTPDGTNTNVITKSFGEISDHVLKLIKNSYEDEEINQNQVGVFYGDYAWEYNEINVEERTDTIYVSTSGNDYIGIGSEENPYATISKAIFSASDGDKIFITAGTYELEPMYVNTYASVGIYDKGKTLEIYGENEKTVLIFDGSTSSQRDGSAIRIKNTTKIRNLTYVFKPKSATYAYSRAIFWVSAGTVENVFFRISGSYKASYLYYNDQTTPTNVKNCTFFHDLGAVFSNYSGTCNFTNIATNVTTNGTNTNVITESFGSSSTTLSDLINASKENTNFVSNQVGVFYGDYAWE